MTKICLLTDTHWGIRGGSTSFAKNQKEFYRYCFFPYLDKHPEIKDIWHLGDAYDKRKNIDFVVLQDSKEMFYDPAKERGLTVKELAGNHDTYYRNTNRVNSPELIISDQYDNIEIIANDIRTIQAGKFKVDIVPWFHGTDMEQKFIEFIKTSDADILIGHLELSGFQMNPGVVNMHGLKSDIFKNYQMVLSGHFHTKSSKGHITYLGAPTEYDWGDYGDPRGFHVLDLETMELEFIQNTFHMFYKFVINEDFDLSTLGCHLNNKNVRLIQDDDCTPEKFQEAIDQVRNYTPNDLDIIERDELVLIGDIDDDNFTDIDVNSTREFINNAVADMTLTDTEKADMIEFLSNLYMESVDE